MARIAEQARLGVGQVYRVFDSKEAIIAHIAAEDLAEMRAMLDGLDGADDVVDALCALAPEAVDRCFDARRVALRVAFAAEAARNLAVGEILRSVDQQGRTAFAQAMTSTRGSQDDTSDFLARCECAFLLFDGLVIRAVNHPDADRAEIARLVQASLRRLFS